MSVGETRPRIIILGKLPPPYMGPAVATEILLGSELSVIYQIHHIDTRGVQDISSFGIISFEKLRRYLFSYIELICALLRYRNALTVIPISQTHIGFIKDSVYIIIARAFYAPYLVQVRGSEFGTMYDNAGSMLRKLIHSTVGRASGAIVLSERLRSMFAGILPEEKIHVAWNGMDIHAFPEATISNKIRVACLSSLHPRKGIEDVIRAVAKLQLRYPDSIECSIGGGWTSDSFKRNIERVIEESGAKIEFLGVVTGERKIKLLADADIFVFTPRNPEGHPWVIVEALAAGLPIIATNKGAIADCVLDGKNGFIVPDHSPDLIAYALAVLVNDGDLRKRMADASHNHYLSRFTEKAMVDNYIQIFESVLSER